MLQRTVKPSVAQADLSRGIVSALCPRWIPGGIAAEKVCLAPVMTNASANHLIASLSKPDQARLLASSTTVDLHFGDTLCLPDEIYAAALFPLTARISLLADVQDQAPVETALIGAEGMLGATLVVGIATAPQRAIVQGGGAALRVPVADLRRQMGKGTQLFKLLQKYLYVQLAQLQQTAACMRFHTVEQRLARWLLLSHDRVVDDQIHQTHQHIADDLGVQRSAVTIAAGLLQARGMIDYSRGDIHVLDRTQLLAASCRCYDALIQRYAQHMN